MYRYVLKINDEFNKIIDEDRIYIPQRRIRDIEYDKENKEPKSARKIRDGHEKFFKLSPIL